MEFIQASRWLNWGELKVNEWLLSYRWMNEGWNSYRRPDDWMEESWKWMNEYKLTVEWRMEFIQASRWLNAGELKVNEWVQTNGWMKDGVHTGFQMAECRRAESEWMSTNLQLNEWRMEFIQASRWLNWRELKVIEWLLSYRWMNEGWNSYRLPDDWMEESWKWMNE